MATAAESIRFYWKNATDEAVGDSHGVTRDELEGLRGRIADVGRQMAQQRQAGKLRYRDLPYDKAMLQSVQREVQHFGPRCEVLIVLGIGGSALGNTALQNALNPWTWNLMDRSARRGPQLFVLDNVDPEQVQSVIDLVGPRLENTIVNVISKSGETAETAAQFIVFRDLLRQRLGDRYGQNILATTDPGGGTLRKIATEEGYRTLEVPEGVGGRFSVLSAVGLFSAQMCGIDAEALLQGAREMDCRCSADDLLANPAALNAAIHYILSAKGKCISVMMPYATSLYSLADWYRQLWAESLGKRYALDGSEVFTGQTPVKALGTTDQHSQVQLYREGPNDKIITFLQVDRFAQPITIPASMAHVPALEYLAGRSLQELINAEKVATEYALAESRRPSTTIAFPAITPRTVGQFLYLYEVTTSYMGGLLGIDTYDQPAVELGKVATFALMGKAGSEEMAANIRPFARREPGYVL